MTVITGPGGLKADGADVALVEAEVTDAQGQRCPTALNLVDFELRGPAEWRGGIAQGPDNYILARSLPVECGVNRVLVRSSTQAGRILLSAKSSGLKPAAVQIESHPVTVIDGLSPLLPGEGLPSNLSRGPTPPGQSFRVARRSIPIARATAGANAERAAASFDDNETTGWSNDGKIATAWIQYEFAQAATADGIDLKLGSWRQRSYPLHITVDGQEVFRGVTPRSLGYVTLPLRPVTGDTLKIELLGPSADQDAFKMTELENDQTAPAESGRVGRGTLNLLEAELYEPIPSSN
jgi:hypothetical protein